ncbi:putative Endonuclease/exonuclease/phosphatase protein [Trachipleistophora hominis]|uniref:Putative Endonuclease/exonuclease/phosphatase protein n=1 Tax=Trachipleistophora hominis TaxID=72359 RepID=L7JYS5_TRAHO|nr:putative Endonuclease/exonuclease/phosphatase protein [Trachipleistophora hominis]
MHKLLSFIVLISCAEIAHKPAFPGKAGGVNKPATGMPESIERPSKPPRTGLYYETKWDPLLSSKTSGKNMQDVLEMGGHYENHEITTPPSDRYGDLSVFTLNIATEINLITINQETASFIHEVLDHAHPAVFVLQGVREPVLARIKKLENHHYGIITDDVFTKDPLSSAHYYFPIIIDKHMIRPIKSGYFRNQKGQVYASYAVLVDTRKNKRFTVVNLDLYSTFKETVEAQFANIVSDIKGDMSISKEPVIFAGGIGSPSSEIQKLLQSGYKNLIDLDPNNKELDKTTVHGRVEHSDNVQRDFIVLRDPATVLDLNYARILNDKLKIAEHYPLHAILSYTS